MMPRPKELSVVVPCYNEEEALPIFYNTVTEIVKSMGITYELVLVDDGSSDHTLDIMRDLARRDPAVRYFSFSRNFGKEAAIFAGLQQVKDYLLNMHFTEEDIEYLRSVGHFTEDFLAYLRDFKFTGDVDAFKEGTIMYPNEPIITVTAPIIEAQLVETELLAQVNHQSLIATKASRIAW